MTRFASLLGLVVEALLLSFLDIHFFDKTSQSHALFLANCPLVVISSHCQGFFRFFHLKYNSINMAIAASHFEKSIVKILAKLIEFYCHDSNIFYKYNMFLILVFL